MGADKRSQGIGSLTGALDAWRMPDFSEDHPSRGPHVSGAVHSRSDDASPELITLASTKLRFNVQGKEGMKEIEGYESEQVEGLDCGNVLLIDMISVPTVDQFVKAVILDIPAGVP